MTEQELLEEELFIWKAAMEAVYKMLVSIGVFACIMFVIGYAWASYVPAKVCSPNFIDRILK